jgi:hypothetical protein
VNEAELRANAMLSELAAQRNAAMDNCVRMAAEIVILKARLALLEKPSESAQ